MRISGLFLLAAIGSFVGSARQAAAIPSDDLLKSLQPTADVNDFAGLLSPAEKESLEARCRLLRERTGAQLAVVTLKSLRGGQIDDFTNKLFARWGIGQREKKNGLLLLVAMDERLSRVEVGYGLEPIIPDVLAARILDHELRPRFRQRQYTAGLSAVVNALCELVEKGELAKQAAPAGQQAKPFGGLAIAALLVGMLFVAIGGLAAGYGLGSREAVTALFGLFFVGAPIFLGWLIAGLVAPLVHVPTALAGGALGWHLAKNRFGHTKVWRQAWSRWPPTWNWNWADTSHSSYGGWSSGGGGFSGGWGGFGGGSSGGGGATSGW